MSLAWVSCSFSCSHTHSSSLAWVSCSFSCSHTHSSSLTWVSYSFSCYHTHSSSLAWVSCSFFLLSYPQFITCMGILLIFPALIPIVRHSRGYLAYFSCSHTHSSSLAWVSCLFLYLHTKLFQVNSAIFNNNAFFSQTCCLLFCSAKSERITQFSLCIHNTKTRNMLRVWIFV